MLSAEPASSTSASAISQATRVLRRRPPWVPPVPPGAPSASEPARSVREARSAGKMPKRSPVATESAAVYASTRPSSSKVIQYGTSTPRVETSQCSHQVPTSTPAAPPASAISTLSVSSCRTMRPRPAPSAARTAISRRRAAPRARSMLPTLAQAISSTKPTAPSIRPSIVPRSPRTYAEP